MSADNGPTVDVVIVNYNGGQYVEECLSALAKQNHKPRQVVVVDNASSDGSAKSIRDGEYPVTLLELEDNTGFAYANNRGFELLKDPQWVALLNPDTIPDPDWLQNLVRAIEANPGHDIYASKLVDASNKNILDGTGDVYHVSGLAWRRHHGIALQNADLDSYPVFTGCGAAIAYRYKSIEEVGGFDEKYFCYYEDVDLGFRVRLNGGTCVFVEDSVVFHHGSAITGKESDFAVYHGHRNLIWTFFKNMPGWRLYWYLPQHLLLNLVTLIYYTLKGRGGVIWRAKLDGFRGLPDALRQRKLIQAGKKASDDEVVQAMVRGLFKPYFSRFE